MSDSTTYSDSDFSPVDGSTSAPSPQANLPAPIVSTGAGPIDMDSWNAQATAMANEGGPGANAEAAQKWLLGKYASASESNTPVTYNDTDFSPLPDTASAAGKVNTTPTYADKLTQNNVLSDPDSYYMKSQVMLAGVDKSVIDYFKNFSKEHQTVSGHTMSPQEMQAAKILNVSPNGVMDYFFGTNTAPNVTHPTYKNDPLTDEDIGLDPVKYVATKSTIPQFVKTVAFPQESSTRQQARIQEVSKLLDIVNNPAQYTPDIVKKAQDSIYQTKREADASIASKVVEGFKGLVQHPLLAAQSFLDPAFLVMGELKLGDMAVGTDLASSVKAGKAARSIAQEAAKFKEQIAGLNVVNKAAVLEKAQKYVDVYTGVAERAAANAKRLQTLKGAGNLVGSAASGAGINAGATAIQENLEEGNVRPIDVASSAATGAILGGTVGALGLGGEGNDLKADLTNRVQDKGTHPNDAMPEGANNITKPGQPLNPNTPLSHDGNIPYTGSVDSNMDGIHIHKDFPKELPMRNRQGVEITIPTLRTVGYHEAVEGPLIHVTGPVDDATIAELQKRIGPNHTLPPETIRKLKAGESLVYTNPKHENTDPGGHEIATWAENHMVDTEFDIEPKLYQNALKPHIKEVAKSSQEPGAHKDIPDTMDTKPYDDVRESDQLKGQGDRPAVDGVSPGAKEGADTKSDAPITDKDVSPINARTIGAAALTLGAGAYGAYQADPNHRTEGTLKGLFGGMTMFGHQAIFAGARARTFDPSRAGEAVRMKGEGKTPEQINFKTGMYEGAGGNWYHEINDKDAVVHTDRIFGSGKVATELRKGKGTPLSSLMDHAELDKAYPGLADKIHVRINPKQDGAYYDFRTGNITISTPDAYPKTGLDTFRKVLLHEVNHAVAHYEGHPRGDSPQTHIKVLQEHVQDLDRQVTDTESRIREAQKEGNNKYALTLAAERDRLEERINKLSPGKISEIAWDRYNRSSGENMSVAVQERADLTPEQRRMQVPQMGHTLEGQRVQYNTEPSPHLTGKLGIGEGVAAHEMPIADHLQKTGEMDDEGKLSGMVLPEDKLPNEPEVLAKAAQNDQGAISKLYKQYMPRLIRNARGLMRTAGPRLGMDAEDLAMYVFHKAIMHLKAGSFKGDSSFYTWMHIILHNTGLNEINRAGRTVPTESIHGATHDSFGSPVSDIKPEVRNIDSGESTPEENMIARQTSNMVQHAISKLPQDIREAIKAYEMEGKSYEEIAKEQGVPVGTVRSRLNRGRYMIEQSIKRGHGANFRKQGGFADTEVLKKLAYAATLGTIGAYIGNQVGSDHSVKDSLIGAGIAIAAGPLISDLLLHPVRSARTVLGGIKGLSVTPKNEDIISMTSRWQGARLKAEVGIYRMVKGINTLAPTKGSRIRINSVMDGDTSIRLTPEEHKAMIVARAFDDEIGKFGLSSGILKELIDNHISHIWKQSEALDKYKAEINATLSSPMPTKSVFAISRKIRSIAEGKSRGLEPVTEDVSEVLSTYAKSMLSAIRNKQLIDSLKNTKPSEGEGNYVMSRGKAPNNYVYINHPALRNSVVHPSIAGEMRQIFYSYDLGDISSLLSTINMGVKRSNVSFSAFHLTSLADAALGGLPTFTHPIQTLKTVVGSPFGKSVYHTALMDKADPATQQLFDRFLNSGAIPQIPKGAAADMDVANNYYQGLKHVQDYLDRAMPYGGKIPEALGVLSHAMDHVIFENGMSAMKFAVWMHSVDKISASYAKKVAKDPSFKVPSQDEIDRMASGFSNNLGGGQNWLQAAQDATTKIGKVYLTALGSPMGRKISQYLLFAPDWTTSTVMSLTKALGKGSEQFGTGPISNALNALDGLRNPKTVADLHRIYQIRSAALYMLLGNIVNLAYSGHPIWENKDRTTIDMGNGQRMQWNKHWMEPAQLVTQFPQAEVNKLGIIPKELLEQTFDKQYLSVGGYAPPIDGRIKHAFTSMAPIPFQDLSNSTPTQLLWNLAGRNVIGHTPEKAHELRMSNRQKALQEKMSKLSGGQ